MDTAQVARKIITEYDQAVSRDEKIVKLQAAARTGLEKIRAASKIADRTGMTTAEVLLSNLLELCPDGDIPEEAARALVRPLMERNHKFVLKQAVQAQGAMNEEAGVGLKPITPGFDTRQADKVVEKITGYEDVSEHPADLEKQMRMASRKTVDDTMRLNAEAHQKAGLEVTVTRIYDGIGVHRRKDKCQWCLERCGENMPYPEAYAKGAFERHPGCGCEIFYRTGKSLKRQTNWKFNDWEDTADSDIILAQRKEYRLEKTRTKPDLPLRMDLQFFGTGKERAKKYGQNWPVESLKGAVDRFAPGSTGRYNANGTKLIYTSSSGDRQIVYDIDGKYFRIENLLRSGKRRFDDINGNDVANITENGRTRGRTRFEYESITHFLNGD